jgi:hypothetical protein
MHAVIDSRPASTSRDGGPGKHVGTPGDREATATTPHV